MKKSLSTDKNEIETNNRENLIEKCILHFLSNNFNVSILPYEN